MAKQVFEQQLATERVLGATLNDPAKLLTLGILATQPNESMSSVDLRDELNRIQGPFDEGYLGRSENNKPMGYCERGLLPAGLVSTIVDDGITFYRATPDAVTYGLPVVGTLLDWQLRHLELPLQSLFGNFLRQAPEGKRNNGVLRLAILDTLSTQVAHSQRDLADVLEEDFGRVGAAIRELDGQGIIKIEKKSNRDDWQVQIDADITDPEVTKYYRATNDNIIGALRTAQALAEEQRTDLTGSEFLDEVIRRHPDLDRGTVWSAVIKSISQGRIKHLTCRSFADGSTVQTRLSIKPQWRAPIDQLVNDVEQLKAPQKRFAQGATRAAKNILNHPASVSLLMVSARPHTKNIRSAEQRTAVSGVACTLEDLLRQIREGIAVLANPEADSVIGQLQKAHDLLEDARTVTSNMIGSDTDSPLAEVNAQYARIQEDIHAYTQRTAALAELYKKYLDSLEGGASH